MRKKDLLPQKALDSFSRQAWDGNYVKVHWNRAFEWIG